MSLIKYRLNLERHWSREGYSSLCQALKMADEIQLSYEWHQIPIYRAEEDSDTGSHRCIGARERSFIDVFTDGKWLFRTTYTGGWLKDKEARTFLTEEGKSLRTLIQGNGGKRKKIRLFYLRGEPTHFNDSVSGKKAREVNQREHRYGLLK